MYEEVFLRRFLAHFKIDTVFDVGANRGQYAMMLRTRANFKGHIISFEPIPELAAELRKAARADPRWHIEEVAITNLPGPALFHVMTGDQFSSLLAPVKSELEATRDRNSVARRIEVRAGTIEKFLVDYSDRLDIKRPFLKTDTQGHDMSVVASAGRRVTDFVGLQSELTVRDLYVNAPRFTESIPYFESLGFALSAVFPNNTGNFPDVLDMDCVMYRP